MGLSYLSKIDPIFPKALHHIMMSVIHQTKPVCVGVHHLEGFQDPSTFGRVTRCLKIPTNFGTPCRMQVEQQLLITCLLVHSEVP